MVIKVKYHVIKLDIGNHGFILVEELKLFIILNVSICQTTGSEAWLLITGDTV